MAPEKNRNSEPTDRRLRTLAEELIDQQSTMTLATAAQSQAWAAPVYYVFYKPAFYFFSDPQSRHIVESTESGQASAAIYAVASTTWREIRGIQTTGTIEQISAGLEAIKVIRAYLKKFPFSKEFFDPNQAMDMASFEKRFRVKLYKFIPSMVWYLDNKIRFGFREEVIFH
jgi:uncharacterized protein